MPKIIEDEQIYRAVMNVISQRGYTGATTKQIAEAADISEVTLFRKYGNKEKLVKQALLSNLQQIDITSAAQYTGDIHADLLRVAKAYQPATVKFGNFIAIILLEIARHPELIDKFDQPLDIFKSLGNLFTQYQKKKLLQQQHPLHTVAAFLGPIVYTTMMRKIIATELPVLDLEKHISLFLEGHGVRKQKS